jgi:RNA polymerase sigma-70 factor, ECF subfamily
MPGANPSEERVDEIPSPIDGDRQELSSTATDVSEDALVARARSKDAAAFELLMRRHNQRVYRVVRSVLHDPSEIEDVMQQAYLQAFAHLDQFGGSARWSTWVCRIAFNEALARLRQRGRLVSIDTVSEQDMSHRITAPTSDPEQDIVGRELCRVLERAIERLPETYRTVLIMREVEGLSTVETAHILSVEPDVIKTRLHRARTALRDAVEKRAGEAIRSVYAFGNERCDRVVAAVLMRLNHQQ